MPAPEKQAFNRQVSELQRKLEDWFAAQLGKESSPQIIALNVPQKAGMSNETLLIDLQWWERPSLRNGQFVARLPPPAETIPIFPNYDFDLQVAVMRLVGARSDVPVPAIHWYERNAAALGAPFFVMERVDGRVAADNPPYIFGGWLAEATTGQQAEIQAELIRILASIHGVEATAEETAFLKPAQPGETPLQRHFSMQKGLYEWGRGDMRFPLVERLIDWLEAHWPGEESPEVICWGDARPANILWQDAKASAVLDWEMATLAPREKDVGYLIFFHKYFQHIAENMTRTAPMPEFLDRDSVVAAYEMAAGTRLTDIDWYIAYALLHQAVTEIRLSMRRIHFGEMDRPDDPDEYLYSRGLIHRVLAGDSDVWSNRATPSS